AVGIGLKIIRVEKRGDGDLFKICNAFRGAGFLLRASERGQQKRSEQRDDRDDREEFDQSEAAGTNLSARRKTCPFGFHVCKTNWLSLVREGEWLWLISA